MRFHTRNLQVGHVGRLDVDHQDDGPVLAIVLEATSLSASFVPGDDELFASSLKSKTFKIYALYFLMSHT